MIKRKKRNKYIIYTTVYALGQHISMSAHKARRVIDQIRGRSYAQTLMLLDLMPYRACFPIMKLLSSAAANGSHNMDFKKGSLFITKAEVNEGSTVKKLKARARGRSYQIKRTSCHIRIELTDISLYEEYPICLRKPLDKKKSNAMTFHDSHI